MIRHRKVQKLLYDYERNEVDERTREQVRYHVGRCKQCARDLEEFRVLLGATSVAVGHADQTENHPDWDALHASIMERIHRESKPAARPWLPSVEALLLFVPFRPRYAFAAGLIVLGIAIILFLASPVFEPDQVAPSDKVQRPIRRADEESLGRYFRQSRALLVGLSNLDPQPGTSVDFSLERELSRQLILDGRSLRGQRLDPRSSKLIGDVDKIMEKVSSTPAAAPPPEIQTIRRDIRGQNLLVKLRVAETGCSPIPVTKVRGSI